MNVKTAVGVWGLLLSGAVAGQPSESGLGATLADTEPDAALLGETEPAVPVVEDAESDSTVIYEADFFTAYNPITARDMLDRIPGLDLFGGGGPRGNNRGLGTGGNILINGQRIAGKDNSPQEQLTRITAAEVRRIEIIRNTSGALNVRGARQVINIVLNDTGARSTTTTRLVTRLNHDDEVEAGGSVAWSRQSGGFQSLVNLESRPNYENREWEETRINAFGDVLGTLLETTIRDQDETIFSTNMSYRTGEHRVQINTQYQTGDFPRPIQRDFIDFTAAGQVPRIETETNANVQRNWEVGGEYEYGFASGARAQILFVVNDEIRDSIRNRFAANPATNPLQKNLFIESNRNTSERIVQGNYSFSLTGTQSLRVGMERADTRLDSSLFIGTPFGSEPPSDRFGGLRPNLATTNPGTEVRELRYEGFAFHNWTLNSRMSLESSLVYETSEISQTGQFNKTRDFQFWRPSLDYRFNIADNLQFRASVQRNINQLSFADFAATADDNDRDIDADQGNPELEQEKTWRYNMEVEYRLPNDAGVLRTNFFYEDIEDFIGDIDATVDPANPLSATGNVGPAKRYGMSTDTSLRLGFLGMPDAIVSAGLRVFDSAVLNPFLNNDQRIGGRGFGNFNYRHDITEWGLSYGVEYRHPIWGGFFDIDANTITRFDNQRSWDLFISKVMFGDVIFRLETDNTFDQAECRERIRFNGSTRDGNIRQIENSCSNRYRRLIFSAQTTF